MNKCIALLALPLLAACATAGAAPARLAGTTWSFVLIDGQRPVSNRASMTITAHSIGVNVGCNGMGGDLVIKPNRLVTGSIISTLMFCDGVMEQEDAISALLRASPRYRVNGDRLTLTAPGHSAKLTRVR